MNNRINGVFHAVDRAWRLWDDGEIDDAEAATRIDAAFATWRGPMTGFRVGHDGSLACPHRGTSCCDECHDRHDEIVEVSGRHFWIDDVAERRALEVETARTTVLTPEDLENG